MNRNEYIESIIRMLDRCSGKEVQCIYQFMLSLFH